MTPILAAAVFKHNLLMTIDAIWNQYTGTVNQGLAFFTFLKLDGGLGSFSHLQN